MRKNSCLMLTGLLFFAWMSQVGYAQSGEAQVEHLTTEQGLSHHVVITVMQDRKGFLWFGTGSGLDKYDGYHFTNYKFDPRDTTSLPKNQVITLWEDQQGMIWVGTSEGTCKFDPRTERFTRLERSARNPYAFKFAQSFSEDQEGNLWVGGSFAGELRQIDKKTGKFSAKNYADLLGTVSDSSERLHFLYKDKSGILWVGSPTGLHQLNLTPQGGGHPARISFSHYRHNPADPNSLSHNKIASMYEDRAGTLWVLTFEGVLNAFDRKSGKFTRYLIDPTHKLAMYGLLRTGMAEDRDGNLWIGTYGNGLFKVDKDRKSISPFVDKLATSGRSILNSINSLLIDKSGILWATTGDGVIKIDPNQKPFGLYRHDPFNANSLSQNNIAAIWEDKAGVVWIGTQGGGLNALTKATRQFTHFRHDPTKPTSLHSDLVGAILEDRAGNLWVGDGQVLSRFDRKKQTFSHYPLQHPFLQNPVVSSIFTIWEDRQGLFWLGTNNGILRFDRKTGKTINYPYDPNHPERVSDWWALSILEDRNDNLWIGPGSQALTRFDRKTGRFTQYKYDSRQPGSISSTTVPCIYEDSKGTLWFGTGEGGLCRFNPATETFTRFTEQQGLAGNSVFSMVEDNAGNLWLGTNNGLSKFSIAEQRFTNYSADEGLQSKLFTTNYTEGAAFKGKDGTLYFGGNNGFNAFDPTKIRPNTQVPPIVITQFKLFDKLMPGKQEEQEIALEYDQNFISFEFSALNYTNSPKNQYAYQLIGLEKNWVYSGSRRYVSYTDLAPGHYDFRVKGANNDGIWNEQGTSIRVIIYPPWWRTWWAYTFYAFLFVAGVWAFIAYRSRALRRENRLLEEKVALRTDQLEHKSNELEHSLENLKATQTQLIQKEKMASLGELTAGIAHEIQNPLNFVNNFSEVSTELVTELEGEQQRPDRDPELEAEILGDLKQNLQKITHHGGRASSIVKGMLEHARTSTGERQPTDLNVLADEYLRLAYQGFRRSGVPANNNEFNCELITDFDPKLGSVEVVPQEIGRVLLNLFNNAFYAVAHKQKTAPADYQPTVSVSTQRSESGVEIRVKDNGTGIPDAVKAKIFQPFFTTKPTGEGTGLGLSLSYDIVTKGHGGTMTVESVDNQWTEFAIILP